MNDTYKEAASAQADYELMQWATWSSLTPAQRIADDFLADGYEAQS